MIRVFRLALALLVAILIAASPAAADWRDEVKSLRVGVLASGGAAYRVNQLEPFRAYLQLRLGIPVELMPLPTYEALIEAQASGRVQYAIHSASSFVTAAASCRCVEPLAVPLSADGAAGFHAVLLARATSPIRSLADARDSKLALSGEDSVAGRLVPMKAFAREGIDPFRFFSHVVEAPDPEATIALLLSGDVDIAVGWSSLTGDAAGGYNFGLLRRMVEEKRLDMSAVRVIWQSPLIPFGPHVVRSDLPADLKPLIADALLQMASEAPDALDAVDRLTTGGGGFAVADAALYATVADLVAPPGAATP